MINPALESTPIFEADISKEIAYSLSTVRRVVEFCQSSQRPHICADVDFWDRWEELHPPHPEWIFYYEVANKTIQFNKGDAPEVATFWDETLDLLHRQNLIQLYQRIQLL